MGQKKNICLKNHSSLDIRTITLPNVSSNSEHVQIYSKSYLPEIGYSVLKLIEIFSRKPLQEASNNYFYRNQVSRMPVPCSNDLYMPKHDLSLWEDEHVIPGGETTLFRTISSSQENKLC